MRMGVSPCLLAAGLGLFACMPMHGFTQHAAEQKPLAQHATRATFERPLVFRGVLGDAHIQLNIRPKAEFDGGLEGEYFFFGQSGHVLLAGEFEDDQMLLEESANGKDVSGHWSGRLTGQTLSGTWEPLGAGKSLPFHLQLLAPAPRRQPAGNGGRKELGRSSGQAQ